MFNSHRLTQCPCAIQQPNNSWIIQQLLSGTSSPAAKEVNCIFLSIPVPLAGGRLLCLLYEKYILELHWQVELFPECTVALPGADQPGNALTASMPFLQSLTRWLQACTLFAQHSMAWQSTA